MRIIKSIIASMLLISLATACSKSREIKTAPQSQDETGIIIQGSDSEAQAIVSQSREYRVLNKKQGLYEVKGLSLSEIKNIAPNITAEKNQYYDKIISSKRKNQHLEDMYLKIANNEGEPSVPAGPQPVVEQPPAFKGCDRSLDAVAPTASISLTTELLSTSNTINLSDTPGFSATTSTAHVDHPSELEFRWDILAPGLSSIPSERRDGETFSFTPDSVGMYQIVLVVKDSRNACGLFIGSFLVTHNPEIEFANVDDEKPTIDTVHFTHLAKIEAEESWKTATGKGITIAVLDTGLQYNHPAIKFNLAVKAQEKDGAANSDDDGNGFDDDILGWDFANGDNMPFDDDGHGSHVSGLSSSHLIGTAKDSKVLPIKVLNAAGGGDVASIIAGIYYAADNGAQVINASLGAPIPEFKTMITAIEHANSKGAVFVVAAGNDSLDLSLAENEIWPAELDVANVITVAATGFDNALTGYSNFGKGETDVAAPGGDSTDPIYSLATTNTHDAQFVASGGTSMASPIVAGVVAQLLEVNPNLTPSEVRNVLMNSGEELSTLRKVVGSGKLLNIPAALELVAPPLS